MATNQTADKRFLWLVDGEATWTVACTAPTADPAEEITDLKSQVTDLGLAKGMTTALNSKLDEALALAIDDTAGACDSPQAFLNHVQAQTGKKLIEPQATQQLTDSANEIRELLDC
jgi:hypothetical protein